MHRVPLVAALGHSADTTARGFTAAATAGHPLVGSWVLANPVADPPQLGGFITFGADGNVFGSGTDVARVINLRHFERPQDGVWEATGPRSGAVALVAVDY
jgi:hypothetical protein